MKTNEENNVKETTKTEKILSIKKDSPNKLFQSREEYLAQLDKPLVLKF